MREAIPHAPTTSAAPRNAVYEPFRHALLAPEEVHELSRIQPTRALRDALLLWAQIGAAWLVVALWPAWWVVLGAVVVIGTREYALQVIGHDGIHRRLASSRRRNDLLCDLLLLGPVGAITRLNGQNHRLHHRLLGREEDPDRFKYDDTGKRSRPATLAFLTGLPGLWQVGLHVFLRPLQGGEKDETAGGAAAGPRGYTTRDLAILAGWQLALLTGLSAAVGWWGYPVLWLLPVYVFTYCPNLARQFLEHAHPGPDADAHRLKSFVSNPVERLFLAPCSMNHHVAHHLWPSIPYYNLAEANRRLRERNASERIVWEPSYASALRAWLRSRTVA